jgi:hypothetical protein
MGNRILLPLAVLAVLMAFQNCAGYESPHPGINSYYSSAITDPGGNWDPYSYGPPSDPLPTPNPTETTPTPALKLASCTLKAKTYYTPKPGQSTPDMYLTWPGVSKAQCVALCESRGPGRCSFAGAEENGTCAHYSPAIKILKAKGVAGLFGGDCKRANL